MIKYTIYQKLPNEIPLNLTNNINENLMQY